MKPTVQCQKIRHFVTTIIEFLQLFSNLSFLVSSRGCEISPPAFSPFIQEERRKSAKGQKKNPNCRFFFLPWERSLLVKSPEKSNLFINLGNLISPFFPYFHCHTSVSWRFCAAGGDLMLSQLDRNTWSIIGYWIWGYKYYWLRSFLLHLFFSYCNSVIGTKNHSVQKSSQYVSLCTYGPPAGP